MKPKLEQEIKQADARRLSNSYELETEPSSCPLAQMETKDKKVKIKTKEICGICGGTRVDNRSYPSTDCECIEEEKNAK